MPSKSKNKTAKEPQNGPGQAFAQPKAVFRPDIALANSKTWLRNVSRPNLALLVLGYITLVHFTGLYVFTRGFLLTRLSIPITSPSYNETNPAPLPARHSKAIVLVIDALRTDFISPHFPEPYSPNHHGVLTLPSELTAQYPDHSLIFNTYSDPPTTTMQRLKGITTGSLPTFIDAGSNFASTAIEEDSIISQAVNHGKKVIFMGDDTWVNLFPNSFTHAYPFDSFNVEDLHSVDNGVIQHLFPYLQPENSTEWDILIGHFLGVDHVGHRVGPYADTMKIKLRQMDDVLRQVVDRMDDETVLVLLGDHGMDPKGNHGGDSELETAAALWMYSKGPALTGDIGDKALTRTGPTYLFPGSTTPIRHLNQIDLLPTLSFLLGLPIPFNNLGSVIPECFPSLEALETATRVNAEQISAYMEKYGDYQVLRSLSDSHKKASVAKELFQKLQSNVADGNDSTGKLSKWLMTGSTEKTADDIKLIQAQHHSITSHRQVSLSALEKLRALWAQFSLPLIVVGLAILGLSIPMLIAIYVGIRNNGQNWDIFMRLALETMTLPSIAVGSGVAVVTALKMRNTLLSFQYGGVGALITSELLLASPLIFQGFPRGPWSLRRIIGPAILAIHALSFASNSFIMWEDRMVLFLLNTLPIYNLFKALTTPTSTMRIRIISFSLAILAITRLIGSITVCREEQQPYCRVTFFSGSTAVAPAWSLLAIPFMAFQIPRAIGVTLSQSKSLAGPAPRFLGLTLRLSLIGCAIYWILEWAEYWPGIVPERIPLIQILRKWLARILWSLVLSIMPYSWSTSSLCIEVKRDPGQTGDEKAVTVFGFANAYGSTYILFFLIPFAAVQLVSQPMAQLALGGGLLVIICHLENTDTQHDALLMLRSFASSNPSAFEPGTNPSDPSAPSSALIKPSFSEATLLALLGLQLFFNTGHQAVLTTIQWKAAFVGFEGVTYPFSPLLVILNTWGPIALSAFAIPLLALWNISPRPQSTIPLLAHTMQLVLAFLVYHTTITFASAFFASWLRRHLMVWKVFAPRFMLAGCTLLIVDLTLLVAVGIGLNITSWKVWKTFKCVTV